VADQQQATVLGGYAGKRVHGLGGIESARQRLVLGEQVSLRLAPALAGQLGGRPRAHLRAVQDEIERDRQAPDRDPRRASLLFPPFGQPPLRVGPRPMRLGLGVT
jgi:hypothetical protein